ncbi:MAG: DinB family protein [Robiginitalea sp.]
MKEIQLGKPWVGPTYEQTLDKIDASQVFRRPLDNLHSVAEIISHLTFWRMETLLKIKYGTGSKTDDCEENWLPTDQLQALGWKKLKSDYDRSLTLLIELLQDKEDDFLTREYYDPDFGGLFPYEFVLTGMVHHDIYHLGQLGLIVKLLNAKE